MKVPNRDQSDLVKTNTRTTIISNINETKPST